MCVSKASLQANVFTLLQKREKTRKKPRLATGADGFIKDQTDQAVLPQAPRQPNLRPPCLFRKWIQALCFLLKLFPQSSQAHIPRCMSVIRIGTSTLATSGHSKAGRPVERRGPHAGVVAVPVPVPVWGTERLLPGRGPHDSSERARCESEDEGDALR